MSTQVIPATPSSHEQLCARHARFVPSSSEERAELLEGTRWSEHLSWPQCQTLSRYLGRYALASSRTLFREGDHDAFAALVVQGALEIHKDDGAGHDVLVATVGRGKIVGELSLLGGSSRSASAVALRETDLLVLSKAEFDRLAAEDPATAFRLCVLIATAIGDLLRQTTGALVEHLGSSRSG